MVFPSLHSCNPGTSEYPQFCSVNSTFPLNSTLHFNSTSTAMYIPGEDVLRANDVEFHLAFNMGIVAVFALVFRVLAYLALRFIPGRHSIR